MRVSSQTSTVTQLGAARTPKRARGRQRVSELLASAREVFAEKGYEAATMTEIAARAAAPIGSLYQFFPVKEALADTLVRNYAALLAADLRTLESAARGMDTRALIGSLFRLLRGHPRERAAAVHRAFVARHLSPGGCADLLAITLFLEALETHS